MNDKIRVIEKFGAQYRNQIAIQLDDVKIAAGSLKQGFSQRAQSGTNFHQSFAGQRMNAGDNSMDDTGVMQEILAKTFARLMAGLAA
jgi:flagellar hook-length control protein FliK